ncbi:TetR/AcrR family transcriptional regulator C-terminal domain-containing protein [Kitasatospora purpeofusca]|uniref:TetR/AcrR family transcriptional regulator C-terminal domain-containing protein n=1 Tax=Kitasatospora purpeofusca TaxID=67352 RepID=UPI00224C9488|nr:TetR/AcrR family transcriptional regulator C-terminal domain-containing protein [Kitasatospora purpeofusca]MCX4759343.1 TetR/AcrR family transcriptional regulator C-terminal domain-containing protein [Kitasatospora purpeofusca]WSR30264.1 TetR/AcrR family transcriptional regulator C-terminal domain-containing protein [Kitasatospora purpeofusca]WSR38498.1 TetR/AcrR family transcriptional regulator C-terminal domain-containing protein [Kitasatospora purpeofusca]
MALQRDEVVRTALRLLDEVGIDGLTTRRLARELGVQSPALYWHFKSKRELLDLMAEAMLAEALPPDREPDPEHWPEWVAADARAKRRGLLAHRDGARVHAGTLPTADELPAVEAQLSALCRAGLRPDTALRLLLTVDRYLMGWVTEEQAWRQDAEQRDGAPFPDEALRDLPLLREAADVLRMTDHDADFEYGLRVLIEGFRTEIARESGSSDTAGDSSGGAGGSV